MTIDKFGRRINDYKNSINPIVSAPAPNFSAVQAYVEEKLKQIYGFMIFNITAGPKKDPKTNFLLLNTSGYELKINLIKCEPVTFRGTNNLDDVEIYVNGNVVSKTNIKGLQLNKNDAISVKEVKPIKNQIRVILLIKYFLYV